MTISATEAAFEGFRVTRHNPLAVLLWGGVWLIGLIAVMLVAAPMIAPFASEFEAAAGDVNALSPDATRALTIAMLAVLPVMLLVQAVLAPAVYRAVLEPEARRFAYIRLGRVEARMLGVVVLLALLSVGLNAGGEALTGLARQAGGMLAALAVSFATFAFTIWISVRLLLAAPLVLRRKGLPIRESWRMTAGVFWPLLGVYLLSIAMTLLVVLLLVLIGWPLTAVLAGGGAGAAIPAVLLFLLIALGMALVSVLMWAPFAAVVGQIDTAR